MIKKIQFNIEEIKSKFKNIKKNTMLIFFCVIILVILTFAFRFVINYVISFDEPKTRVLEWDYQFIENIDDKLKTDSYKSSSYVTPIDVEKNKNYCYLTHTFSKIQQDTLLVIDTEYSAIKIVLNGEVLYDNHYGQSLYVGNRYNSIPLKQSAHPTNLEVYMSVPFNFTFEVTLNDYNGSTDSFVDWSIIFAGIVFVAMLIFLILSVIFSISKRSFSHIIYVYAIGMFITFSFGLRQLLGLTYRLNSTIFVNILFMSVCFSMAIVSFVLTKCTTHKTHLSRLMSLFALISAGSLFFITIPLLWQFLTLLSALFSAASIFLNINEFNECISKRIRYTKPVCFASFYLALLWFIGTALWTTGIRGYFELITIITLITFLTVGIVSLFEKSAISRSKAESARKQLDRDTEWIYGITRIIGEIVSQRDEESVLRVAANEIIKLICHDATKEQTVGCCLAILENDKNNEIYRNNILESCNYGIILNRYKNDPQKLKTYFGQTYIDLIFTRDDKVHSVMHFENIDEKIDLTIESIIKVISANVGVILSYSNSETNNEIQQKRIFSNLAEMIDGKFLFNPTHLKNVPYITECICHELALNQDMVSIISEASVLHDIGKIALPSNIIDNTGYLSETEKKIVEMHTEFGYELLAQFTGKFMEVGAEIARYHHEAYDGSGYNGLIGDQIPLSARIVTIADVYDALTSKRSYKESWSSEKARSYINEKSGKQFDPLVVDAFNRSFDKFEQLNRN